MDAAFTLYLRYDILKGKTVWAGNDTKFYLLAMS